MNQRNKKIDQGNRASGRDPGLDQTVDRPQLHRQNPRLVFTDPDRFFKDLLMEQQEQG